MTSGFAAEPDQLLPGTATNVASYAAFAATTQADYEAQMRQSLLTGTGLAQLAGICQTLQNLPFFTDLSTGFSDVATFGLLGAILHAVQGIADQIGALFPSGPAINLTPTLLLNVATPTINNLIALFGDLSVATVLSALNAFSHQLTSNFAALTTTVKNDLNTLFGQQTWNSIVTSFNGSIAGGGANAVITDATNAMTGLMSNLGSGTATLAAITNRLASIGPTGVFTDITNILDSAGSTLDSLIHPHSPGTIITNIPASSVKVPDNPVPGGITHNNTATQSATGSTPTLSTTWNHTVGSKSSGGATYYASCLTVKLLFTSSAANPAVLSSAVSYGGANMALLAATHEGFLYTQVWGLLNPPTGTNTVSATATVLTGLNSVTTMRGASDSYFDVSAFGATAVINSGTTGTPTATIASSANNYVAQTIAALGNSSMGTFVGYSGSPTPTSRANDNTVSGANSITLLSGDVAGSSTVSFAVTASVNIADWTAIAINLLPIPAVALGSGIVIPRTSATQVTPTTGSSTLPANFYDATPATITSNGAGGTDDYVWTQSTNTVTVVNSGWYLVEIALIAVASSATSVGVLLYKNAAIYKTAGTFVYASSNAPVVQATFVVPCSAGDALQPGLVTQSGWKIYGDTLGQQALFSVSLLNRSLA